MSTITVPPIQTNTLSPLEVDRFFREGYLGPFAICTPEEMEPIRDDIVSRVFPSKGVSPQNHQARHLDHRVVYDLCAHPAILDRVAGILGEDIVMWASYFFVKDPGGQEIPWHQDANYWPIEPPVNISAWMALDECTVENSCVQIIPGSHRKVVPHIASREGMRFQEEANPEFYDASKAVNMELKPGEFFLFNERTLHHSEMNRSNKRRIGLSMRYTLPQVKILDQEAPPLFPGHRVVVVRGEDRMHFNRVAPPPTR